MGSDDAPLISSEQSNAMNFTIDSDRILDDSVLNIQFTLNSTDGRSASTFINLNISYAECKQLYIVIGLTSLIILSFIPLILWVMHKEKRYRQVVVDSAVIDTVTLKKININKNLWRTVLENHLMIQLFIKIRKSSYVNVTHLCALIIFDIATIGVLLSIFEDPQKPSDFDAKILVYAVYALALAVVFNSIVESIQYLIRIFGGKWSVAGFVTIVLTIFVSAIAIAVIESSMCEEWSFVWLSCCPITLIGDVVLIQSIVALLKIAIKKKLKNSLKPEVTPF